MHRFMSHSDACIYKFLNMIRKFCINYYEHGKFINYMYCGFPWWMDYCKAIFKLDASST